MHIVQVIDGDNRTVYPSVAAASRATGSPACSEIAEETEEFT